MIECQEVADRVLVFGPRETAEQRHVAGVGLRGGRRVQLAFEERRRFHIVVVRGARVVRRHRFRAQLAHDLLPLLGVRTHAVQAAGVDHEVGREVDRVMAIDAVVRQQLAAGVAGGMRLQHPPGGAESGDHQNRDDDQKPLCHSRHQVLWPIEFDALYIAPVDAVGGTSGVTFTVRSGRGAPSHHERGRARRGVQCPDRSRQTPRPRGRRRASRSSSRRECGRG